MEERNSFICSLLLWWYVSNVLFDLSRKQRLNPIICPGKFELLADMMGGGLTDLVEPHISARTRMTETPLLV